MVWEGATYFKIILIYHSITLKCNSDSSFFEDGLYNLAYTYSKQSEYNKALKVLKILTIKHLINLMMFNYTMKK